MKRHAAHHSEVGAYYDRNTRRFLRFVGGSGALHRKLWPPEVSTERQALLFVNRIVLEILKQRLGVRPLDHGVKQRDGISGSRVRVIDLGCGVGGTMLWLAERLDARFSGITLSPVQAEIARETAARRGLDKRCTFQVSDILEFKPQASFHGAVAVESFAHVESAEEFFGQVAGLLARRGVLVLIDDMIAEDLERHPEAERWIRRFTRGWHLHGLTTVSHIVSCALRKGLVLIENRDLTSLIRVNPVVLFFLRPLLPIPLPWYFWDNVRGGIALQLCTRRGYTRYHCMVFRKD